MEEQQRTEKGSDFLQNVGVTEGVEGVEADLSGVLPGDPPRDFLRPPGGR